MKTRAGSWKKINWNVVALPIKKNINTQINSIRNERVDIITTLPYFKNI